MKSQLNRLWGRYLVALFHAIQGGVSLLSAFLLVVLSGQMERLDMNNPQLVYSFCAFALLLISAGFFISIYGLIALKPTGRQLAIKVNLGSILVTTVLLFYDAEDNTLTLREAYYSNAVLWDVFAFFVSIWIVYYLSKQTVQLRFMGALRERTEP